MVFQGQAGPILVGVASWTFATLQQHNFEKRQAELNSLSEKIRVLYGPLHGNRLVYKSSYRAITKQGDLRAWLKEAQDTKNAEMIRQWRKFHLEVLHPLDLEAVRLIKENSHLFHQESCGKINNDVPISFTDFIEHVSGAVYQMELWKNQVGALETNEQMSDSDFLVENNLVGFDCQKLNSPDYGPCGTCGITENVTETLKQLRDRKSELENDQKTETSVWGSLVALSAIFANYAS